MSDLQAKLRAAELEIDRLLAEGTPGVMHAVDKAFYDLAIKQRDAAWAALAEGRRKSTVVSK